MRNTVELSFILPRGREVIGREYLNLPPAPDDLDSADTGLVLRFAEPPTLDGLRDADPDLLLARFDGNRRTVGDVLRVSERNPWRILRSQQ